MTDDKDKPDDRVGTPEEYEELRIMQLRDRFFVSGDDPKFAEARAAQLAKAEQQAAAKAAKKATRKYWRTVHAFAALMDAAPMNERRAWIQWLESRFVKAVEKAQAVGSDADASGSGRRAPAAHAKGLKDE